MSCREKMLPRYPEKQRNCIKFGVSMATSRRLLSLVETSPQGKEAWNKAHGARFGSKGRGAPKIHTRCLHPILQAYYHSLPTLLEESCSYLGPRRAQGRAEEPFGGGVKLMPQSHFRSQQCLHSLRRYRSQYGIFKARTRALRECVFCSPKRSRDPNVYFQVREERSEIYLQ